MDDEYDIEYASDEVIFWVREFLLDDFELTSEQLDRVPAEVSGQVH